MVTAWKKYKEKLLKQGAGKQKKQKDVPSAETVTKSLAKVVTDLEALDTSGWSPAEKDEFKQTLLAVQQAVQNHLKS